MQVDFRADSFRCRVYSGHEALAALPSDLKRLGIDRALIVCGQTVSRKTPLIEMMRGLVGDRCAAVFDEAGRHADEAVVQRVADLARRVSADGFIAVGAGSVIMTARLAAIVLAEARPVEELVTTYEERQLVARSPRLDAPKLPIINVLTASTNAQNRAGSAMRREGAGRRLEMFDPKTRPSSIYWDSRALMTAPARLAAASGFTTFWWSFMMLGGMERCNPLSQADRLQSFSIAHRALPRMVEDDAAARIEMCAASFLQNRDEDSGGCPFEVHWVFRVCYALGSGIFTADDTLDPGYVYACLTGPAIAYFGDRNLSEIRAMCQALEPQDRASLAGAGPVQLAGVTRSFLTRHGVPLRLRDLGVPRERLNAIRDFALRNFNADRRRELLHEVPLLDRTLEAAW